MDDVFPTGLPSGYRGFVLRRLERSTRLALDPTTPPPLNSLARRAILTAYRDCTSAGLVREANRTLRRVALDAYGGPQGIR